MTQTDPLTRTQPGRRQTPLPGHSRDADRPLSNETLEKEHSHIPGVVRSRGDLEGLRSRASVEEICLSFSSRFKHAELLRTEFSQIRSVVWQTLGYLHYQLMEYLKAESMEMSPYGIAISTSQRETPLNCIFREQQQGVATGTALHVTTDPTVLSLSLHLPLSLSLPLSLNLSISLSISLSLHLPLCLPLSLSISPSLSQLAIKTWAPH